jgi:anti-anti-sigma factor
MAKTTRKAQRLTIEDDMTIYNAPEQKTRLLMALAKCDELELDLSQISEMDTAGFQLLVLAKREALRAGKALNVTEHSRAVTDLLDLYNMASYFGDPVVIPAREQETRRRAP